MTLTSQEQKNIGGEIIRQLGGHRFIAMTGARYFVALENGGAAFQFRGSKVANICQIELDASDTYTVTFKKFHGANVRTIGEPLTGVYNDMLQSIFTDVTGLACHL